MSGTLSASYYADCAVQTPTQIVENVQLARDTFRVRLYCPELARRVVPGQFVMVRMTCGDDPLLARPLALYDTVVDQAGNPIGIDLVYLVVGRMTSRLAQCGVGESLTVWGPLGNGFAPTACEHLVMVAGGIGQTPFVALAAEALGKRTYGDPDRTNGWAKRVSLCYGVRTAAYAAGVSDFERQGVRVLLTTDDGTLGQRGLVTDSLRTLLAESRDGVRLVVCGPERMMEAVAELAHEQAVRCEVSLETPMACGIGICFSCVAKVRQSDGTWDYKRTCVEGPIFDAAKLVW